MQKISDAAGVFLRASDYCGGDGGGPVGGVGGDGGAVLVSVRCDDGDPEHHSVCGVGGLGGVLIINGLGADSLHSLFYALLWPTLVYGFAQFLDGWVLSPWLEGGLLRLHPVVVLFAILAGGAVAGALGMVMAIPLAAAWQICFADVIKPRLIEWANTH